MRNRPKHENLTLVNGPWNWGQGQRHVADWHVLLIINKHTQYCWPTTNSNWETDLSIKTWPWSMDHENEVKDIWHMADWHVLLIMYKHTQYCWPIKYSYWETDLSMKTWCWRFKSHWTMQSRSRTKVMWFVRNFISRTISTLILVILSLILSEI